MTATATVRRLVCIEPGRFEWQDLQLPPVGPGQVLVKSEFAAPKHGTELGFFKGTVQARGTLDASLGLWRPGASSWGCPFPLGNMMVGRVESVAPDVAFLQPGDRVLCYCPFQQMAVVDASACWRLPAELSWKSAVCLDPANFAFAAVRDGQVRIGDAVAVFGLGAIGLMAVQLARLAGADPVIGVDTLPSRLQAAERLGATRAFDMSADDVAAQVKEFTSKRGVDVAIEFRGSAPSLQQALRSVAFGGTVVAGAMPGPYPAGLDFGGEAHLNRPNIVFSRSCSDPNRDHPRWDERRVYATCFKWICEGRLNGEPIVDRVVRFDDLEQAYLEVAKSPTKQIKLGVAYG